ncbi:MAG: histone deacetylase [Methanomassiliicoccales archaeon]|jgi:acetoin utilization deacetylase AcuC-like enzyme|nr:histone deacetylase [Methanomassiliicoccales archaeon]
MTIVFHERYLDHFQYSGHPECPDRLVFAVRKMLDTSVWKDVIRPEPASDTDLLLVHTKDHIERIKTAKEGFLDPDTYIRKETYEIALLAAGGAIAAARIAYDSCRPALALVRPPGHHAGKDFCGGFCYFNNIAIAARKLSLDRIAIVDIDVHHGNGTEDIFFDDDKVLFISTHQYGIYPGTGAAEDVGTGTGEGYTINIPLRSGVGDETYLFAFDRIIKPVIEQYDPECLLVSIGIDAHYADPIASLRLSTIGYLELCRKLIDISPDRKIAFILEGGYDLEATAEVLAGLGGLICNKEIPMNREQPKNVETINRESVERVINIQRKYWDL